MMLRQRRKPRRCRRWSGIEGKWGLKLHGAVDKQRGRIVSGARKDPLKCHEDVCIRCLRPEVSFESLSVKGRAIGRSNSQVYPKMPMAGSTGECENQHSGLGKILNLDADVRGYPIVSK